MIDGEMIRFIKEEIKKQVNIILSGSSGTNDQETETISNMYPGMPDIIKRPVMHPYGLVSRAPNATTQVTARQGEHPGNRLVLGHRDSNRPVIGSGETLLYNQFGQMIYLESGKIHIGKKGSSNPVLLGTEVKKMLQDLITLISTHTHNIILPLPGTPTTPTLQAAQFVTIQTTNVDNNKILSDYIFVEKAP